MAVLRARGSGDIEAKLRDIRIATWVPAEVETELRNLMAGPRTRETLHRVEELGAGACGWAVGGKVPSETPEDDVLRALVGVAAHRHGAAVTAHAEALRADEAAIRTQLDIAEHDVWGCFCVDKSFHVRRGRRMP